MHERWRNSQIHEIRESVNYVIFRESVESEIAEPSCRLMASSLSVVRISSTEWCPPQFIGTSDRKLVVEFARDALDAKRDHRDMIIIKSAFIFRNM